MNKLSKPVAWSWIGYPNRKQLTWVQPENWKNPIALSPLYAQEYVSALLAEIEFEKQNNAGVAGMIEDYETKLEEKDRRIAELEAKLATPVRLPEAHSTLFRQHIRSDYQSLQAFKADEVIAALHAAGFTVEGDE